MMEQNGLDTLVALRILIEALRMEGLETQPEDRPWKKEPASAATGRRQARQDNAGASLSDRSR